MLIERGVMPVTKAAAYFVLGAKGNEIMKVFLAGATGAIGRRLVPLLKESGHTVLGTTRSRDKARLIEDAGGQAVVVNCLDSKAVMQVVMRTRPDAIIHQLTDLTAMKNLKKFDDGFDTTSRLRIEGTQNLIDAGRAAGVRLFIAQSYTGWPNSKGGSRLKSEEDPLDAHPPKPMERSLKAILRLESMVSSLSGMTGVVLRYGSLYGPGTSLAPGGDIFEAVRARKLPLIGGGAGIWSFTHVDDAAAATISALECAKPGVFNIVDNEPAEVSVWLPELARQLGAKAPYSIPRWIGRLAVGDAGVSIMTEIRGSSNAKAKRELGWAPMYPSWREGFCAEASTAAQLRTVHQ